MTASLVLLNGRLWSPDGSGAGCDAVVVTGGRIADALAAAGAPGAGGVIAGGARPGGGAGPAPDLRHHLAHLQFIRPDDLDRFRCCRPSDRHLHRPLAQAQGACGR
jgi:predicted amidohydrolase YtcJ